MKDSTFEGEVRDALAERGPEDAGSHLSPVTLTEMLEGTLPEEERTAAEAHLVQCTLCREWAMAAAEALQGAVGETSLGPTAGAGEKGAGAGTVASHSAASGPQPHRKAGPQRWGWAAAAVLVLAASLWQWQEHRPGAAKPEARVEAWVAQARQGELPEVDLFPDLDSTGAAAGAETQLRSSTMFDRPLQIAPRWSRILGRRPTFVFATLGEGQEILLVDGTETFVAAIPVQGNQHVGELLTTGSVPLPDSLADLTPGGRYAWKLNSRIDGELVSSAYVPFEVLSEEESTALARHLEIAGDDLFRRGAVFAGAGLWGEASRAFGRWSGRGEPDTVTLATELLTELCHRQKLPPELGRAGPAFPPLRED